MSRALPVAMAGLPILPAPHFPKKLTALHQIEVTTFCSLKCSYCPSPEIVRGRAGRFAGRGGARHMHRQTFLRALEHVKHYALREGTQAELNMAGIGEPTLHPEFVEFVTLARLALPSVKLIWATNGVKASEAQAERLARLAPKPIVFVSLHRPEVAGPAVQLYKRHGLLGGVSADPSINANDWGGQVTYAGAGNPPLPCSWLREGRAMVMADGRVTSCCLDASGDGVIGHVDDEIGSLTTKPYGLCATCHHVVSVDGYDQRG